MDTPSNQATREVPLHYCYQLAEIIIPGRLPVAVAVVVPVLLVVSLAVVILIMAVCLVKRRRKIKAIQERAALAL